MLRRAMEGPPRPGLQERIEQSRTGRAVISGVLVVLLAVVVLLVSQPSPIREQVVDTVEPAIFALGLDQYWGVFAPDPRNVVLRFHARVHYRDGTTETWTMPSGGPLLGEYWDYRWRKYVEYVVPDQFAALTRRQIATYIARDRHRGGRVPVRVVLVRRWQTVRPPGSATPRSPWREQAYFTLRVDPKALAA